MKFIVCLLIIMISAKECEKKQDSLNDSSTENSEMRIAQEMVKISYRASTRGFFEVIEITGDSASFTKDYNLKNIDKVALPQEEKADIINLLSKIDINSITELEPPSKTHQYDAAPAAFLKITRGDAEFMTPSFDHGNPPKAISDIVEKILSLKTLFEKP